MRHPAKLSNILVQTNYCNNILLILDVKQLNKIMKLYFYTLKALWDGQGKIKMHYGMSRVKKQSTEARSNTFQSCTISCSPLEIFHQLGFSSKSQLPQLFP